MTKAKTGVKSLKTTVKAKGKKGAVVAALGEMGQARRAARGTKKRSKY